MWHRLNDIQLTNGHVRSYIKNDEDIRTTEVMAPNASSFDNQKWGPGVVFPLAASV